MGFLSWLRGGSKAAVPATATTAVLAGMPGAVYPEVSFEGLIRVAFKGNEIVNRALGLKAASLAAAPLIVRRVRDDEELKEHPLRQLLHIPNPWMSEYDLWETVSYHLDLAGNAYLQIIRSSSRRPVMLWPLRPDNVTAMVDPEKGLLAYKHQMGASLQIIAPGDMIHVRLNDPSNPWIGYPPLASANRRVAIDNEAADFAKSMLQNKAIPGIVIETDIKIDQATSERLGEVWMNAFSRSKRGRPAFLQKGMTIKEVGLNMQELAFNELNATDEARILMALGVPPSIVGAKVGLDRSTFSNAEEARRSFYEDTMEPIFNRVDDAFNRQLTPDFGSDIYLVFDTSDLAAYRSIRIARRLEAQQGLIAGALTVNEYRQAMGLPAVREGDVFIRTIAMMEIPAATSLPRKSERKLSPGPSGVGMVAAALGRRGAAEKWQEKIRKAAAKEFGAQGEDVLAVLEGRKAAGDDQLQAAIRLIAAKLADLKLEWRGRSFSSLAPLLGAVLNQAAKMAADEIGIEFELGSAAQQAFVRDYGFKFAAKISESSVEDVRAIIARGQAGELDYPGMLDALKEKFTSWSVDRADLVARSETIRASNYGAKEAWRQSGIEKTQWLAADDACPDCLEFNGTVTGIDENYLAQDEDLPASGRTNTYEDVGAPPLHAGCRCTLIAVVE